jgi:hypothetical protein
MFFDRFRKEHDTGKMLPEIIFEINIRGKTESEHLLDEDGESGKKIEGMVIQTLTVDLKNHLREIFGLDVIINIKGSYYGSLTVFFGAIIVAYEVVSRYKSFNESIRLIEEQTEHLLERNLRPLHLYVQGIHSYSTLPVELMIPSSRFYRSSRDAFFYFLLALSAIEALVICLLVYGAVVKTYFSS